MWVPLLIPKINTVVSIIKNNNCSSHYKEKGVTINPELEELIELKVFLINQKSWRSSRLLDYMTKSKNQPINFERMLITRRFNYI